MVEIHELAFVFGTALLGWLVAVTATNGWSEPVIIFWAAVVTFGASAVFVAAESVDLSA